MITELQVNKSMIIEEMTNQQKVGAGLATAGAGAVGVGVAKAIEKPTVDNNTTDLLKDIKFSKGIDKDFVEKYIGDPADLIKD